MAGFSYASPNFYQNATLTGSYNPNQFVENTKHNPTQNYYLLTGQTPGQPVAVNLGYSTSPSTTSTPVNAQQNVSLPAPVDPFESQRQQIESSYGTYFANLDSILSTDLPGSKTAQEQTIQNQYQSNLADLQSQKEQGLKELATTERKTEEQKVKSLRDIGSNIRNQLFAGQVYLGARGAGDSSATNQYSYALNRLGNQQKGNIINQTASIVSDINDRRFKINNIFNTESQKLLYERDTRINQIAQWYQDAISQIKQLRGQAEISKGKDITAISQSALNYAMQMLSLVQNQYRNQYNSLGVWAYSRGQEAANQFNQQASYNPTLPSYTPLNLNSIMGTPTPTPYYSTNVGTQKKWNPNTLRYE